MVDRFPRRGDVYFANMPTHPTVEKHSCERGYRPVVIISSDAGNRTNSMVVACPLTTKIKDLSCNANVSWTECYRKSQVLCNQIVSLPKDALIRYAGHMSNDDMYNIERGIRISLNLLEVYNVSEC